MFRYQRALAGAVKGLPAPREQHRQTQPVPVRPEFAESNQRARRDLIDRWQVLSDDMKIWLTASIVCESAAIDWIACVPVTPFPSHLVEEGLPNGSHGRQSKARCTCAALDW